MKYLDCIHLLSQRKKVFLYAASGDYFGAAKKCVEVLKESNLAPNDCANLSYLTQEYLSIPEKKYILKCVEPMHLDKANSRMALFLFISLKLQTDFEKGKTLFERLYIDKILRPSIQEWRKPLLFWHIPKCSGTSLCQALAYKHYGRPLGEVVPGYNFMPMVKLLVETYPEAAPFISANHLHTHEIHPADIMIEFTILRDPVKRALSMYRQEASTHLMKTRLKQVSSFLLGGDKALKHQRRHYKVLPRYRHFWDCRNDTTFEGWLTSIPKTLLNSQTYTFSKDFDIKKAANRVSRIRSFKIDPEPESYDDLLSELDSGLTYQNLPDSLNASSKNIRVSDSQVAALNRSLEKDKSFIDALMQ